MWVILSSEASLRSSQAPPGPWMQMHSCRSMKPLLGHIPAGGPRKEIATVESRGVSRPETDCGSDGQNLRAYICCIHECKLDHKMVMSALLPAALSFLGTGIGKGKRALSELSQQIKQNEERAKESQRQMLE